MNFCRRSTHKTFLLLAIRKHAKINSSPVHKNLAILSNSIQSDFLVGYEDSWVDSFCRIKQLYRLILSDQIIVKINFVRSNNWINQLCSSRWLSRLILSDRIISNIWIHIGSEKTLPWTQIAG